MCCGKRLDTDTPVRTSRQVTKRIRQGHDGNTKRDRNGQDPRHIGSLRSELCSARNGTEGSEIHKDGSCEELGDGIAQNTLLVTKILWSGIVQEFENGGHGALRWMTKGFGL